MLPKIFADSTEGFVRPPGENVPNGSTLIVPLTVPSLPVCQSVVKNDLKLYGAGLAKEVAGVPVKAFVEKAKNDKAAKNNEATAYGVSFGNANAPGKWEVSYLHQEVELSSISTVWTDSDFANATVGNDGYGVTATYAVTDSLKARAIVYNADVGAVKPVKYKRTLLDLIYTF